MITQDQLDRALHTELDYPDDCRRIQSVAAQNGLQLTLSDCQRIWRWWSDRVAAGWLYVDDTFEILDAIRCYVFQNAKEDTSGR